VDIFSNSALPLLAFRKNLSFFAIDMDRLALDDPGAVREVAMEVGRHMQEGHYHPLPIKTFPMGKIREALEFMKKGQHTGKVVLVNYDEEGRDLPSIVERPSHIFRPDMTYVITGGAGGLGAKLVWYALQKGARHFIITTRSEEPEAVRAKFEMVLREQGASLTVVRVDTGEEEDVRRLMEVAKTASPPVRSIFHLAGGFKAKKIEELEDGTDFDTWAGGKARGAWLLSEMSQAVGLDLEQFVVVSSIAGLIGGAHNAVYSAANAYLDALIRERRAKGLPGLTYNMGSIADVGILVKNAQARRFQDLAGMEYMTAFRAIEELELGLMADLPQVRTAAAVSMLIYHEECAS
jgi:NAD(P)-dependent dehydrogenase (short-subunit alcohol dehydrogenase family)